MTVDKMTQAIKEELGFTGFIRLAVERNVPSGWSTRIACGHCGETLTGTAGLCISHTGRDGGCASMRVCLDRPACRKRRDDQDAEERAQIEREIARNECDILNMVVPWVKEEE